MDNATCSTSDRRLFLQVAYDANIIWPKESAENLNRKAFLTWCIQRGVRLAEIQITPELWKDMTLLKVLVAVSGPVAKKISCRYAVTDFPVEFFDCCKELVSFEVMGDPWSNAAIIARVVEHCPKLECVVHCGEIWPEALQLAFGKCTNLKELRFCGFSSEHNSLHEVLAIPSLEVLKAYTCYLPVALQLAIGRNCRKLRTLRAFSGRGYDENGFDGMTDTGMRAILDGCPLLTDIDVERSGASLSTELRVEMAKRRNLTALNMCTWLEMDNSLFTGICKVSPNLKCVYQNSSASKQLIRDEHIITLAEHCPLLEKVTFTQGSTLTDKAVRALARPGNNLRSLVLSLEINPGANADDAMVAVGQNCPHLEELVIPRSTGDRGVIAIAKGCPNLIYLDLSGCPITDAGLTAVMQHCRGLKCLLLRDCHSITEAGVRMLRVHYQPDTKYQWCFVRSAYR